MQNNVSVRCPKCNNSHSFYRYGKDKDGFQKYHTKYILVFLKQIASTYQSNRVILSDGRGCTIVMLNQNALSRPIVQFDDKSCLDLSTASRDLYIKAVL